jgi:hypothetical protein
VTPRARHGADQKLSAWDVERGPLVSLHRGFDRLSERTALHPSAEMRRWSVRPGLSRVHQLARRSKSAAIWGTAAVVLTHSRRQPVTHSRPGTFRPIRLGRLTSCESLAMPRYAQHHSCRYTFVCIDIVKKSLAESRKPNRQHPTFVGHTRFRAGLKLIETLIETRKRDNFPPPRTLLTQCNVSGNDFA